MNIGWNGDNDDFCIWYVWCDGQGGSSYLLYHHYHHEQDYMVFDDDDDEGNDDDDDDGTDGDNITDVCGHVFELWAGVRVSGNSVIFLLWQKVSKSVGFVFHLLVVFT